MRCSLLGLGTVCGAMGVLAGLGVLLGACDRTGPAGSDAPGASSRAPSSGVAPIQPDVKDRYVFGFVAKSGSNPVYLAARAGAEFEARKIGASDKTEIEIIWRCPAEEDASRQSEIINELVQSGVDGIAISCSDASVATPSIDRAVASGVEVVTFDSDAPSSSRCGYYGINDADAGGQLYAQMCELLGDEGKIAILAGNRAATNITQRVIGAAIEARRHPGTEIVGVFHHEETPLKARAAMLGAQEKAGPIDGWVLVGGWPLYDPAGLEGVSEGVKIVSMDPLPPAIDHASQGRVQGFVAQPYFQWGSASVRMLYTRVRTGEAPDPTVQVAKTDVIAIEDAEAYRQKWVGWVGRPELGAVQPDGTGTDDE